MYRLAFHVLKPSSFCTSCSSAFDLYASLCAISVFKTIESPADCEVWSVVWFWMQETWQVSYNNCKLDLASEQRKPYVGQTFQEEQKTKVKRLTTLNLVLCRSRNGYMFRGLPTCHSPFQLQGESHFHCSENASVTMLTKNSNSYNISMMLIIHYTSVLFIWC